jgi:DNA helicase-2/ATP-dependent DNA helicase PcrA
MTLQNSKGLEAHSVYVIGLEEGTFPADSSASDVTEQARLLLVAMTRAKDNCISFMPERAKVR